MLKKTGIGSIQPNERNKRFYTIRSESNREGPGICVEPPPFAKDLTTAGLGVQIRGGGIEGGITASGSRELEQAAKAELLKTVFFELCNARLNEHIDEEEYRRRLSFLTFTVGLFVMPVNEIQDSSLLERILDLYTEKYDRTFFTSSKDLDEQNGNIGNDIGEIGLFSN